MKMKNDRGLTALAVVFGMVFVSIGYIGQFLPFKVFGVIMPLLVCVAAVVKRATPGRIAILVMAAFCIMAVMMITMPSWRFDDFDVGTAAKWWAGW